MSEFRAEEWPVGQRRRLQDGHRAAVGAGQRLMGQWVHREQEWGPSEEDREEDRPPEAEKRRSGQVASGH